MIVPLVGPEVPIKPIGALISVLFHARLKWTQALT